jgi:hypothetical protein
LRFRQERIGTDVKIYDIPLTSAETVECADGEVLHAILRVPLAAVVNVHGPRGMREFVRNCFPPCHGDVTRCEVVGYEPPYTGDNAVIRGYIHLRVTLIL